MNTSAVPARMTMEEFLALPEDGMDRWLIRGQLRVKPMTYRNRYHSAAVVRIGHLLLNWLEQQPEPRGNVLSGEAGCRIRKNPDTFVGIDVVYISATLATENPEHTTIVDGVPVLAVEVISPSDTKEEMTEKVKDYLAAGVSIVWLVDPYFQIIQIFRPDAKPEQVNDDQELTAEPHLPGFRVPVAEIFSR